MMDPILVGVVCFPSKLLLIAENADTSSLIDKLDAAGAKGTFFFTGTLYGNSFCPPTTAIHRTDRMSGCIYNQKTAVKKAYDNGHQVSSHTWYDEHFPNRPHVY